MIYALDVDDAIVTIRPWQNNAWWWSFTWTDGSCNHLDSDWQPTLRGAKQEAKAHYDSRTKKLNSKKAKWIKK